MSRRTLAIALGASLAIASCAPRQAKWSDEVAAFDAQVVLPPAAAPRVSYVRFYVLIDARSGDDLPFTTMMDGIGLRPGKVLVGVFIKPGEWNVAGPPGVRLVASSSALPLAVHGGCRAVNVVVDPASGRTLGSWCNVDESLPPGPQPGPSTAYVPAPAD